MFKRKLFRRALPMILSVAMVFQSVPATAMAAEYEETETTVEQLSAEDEAQEESRSDDSVHENETESAADNDEKNPETEEEVPEDSVTKLVTEATAAEAAETAATEMTAEAAAEEVQNELENNADAETLNAEIVIKKIRYDGFETDTDSDSGEQTVTAIYNQEKENPFKELLDYLKNNNIISVQADSSINGSLTDNLQYKWEKKNEDGTYAPIEAAPSNAGTYRLALSIDEKLAKAEQQYINFVIDKAELTIGLEDKSILSGLSGKTASEAKTLLSENLKITLENDGNKETEELSYYFDKTDASVFSIRLAGDNEKKELDAAYQIKKGDDIVIETKAALKADFASNYEVKQLIENVAVTELKNVTITATVNPETEDAVTYEYGNTIAPTIGFSENDKDKNIIVKVTLDGERDEQTGEPKVLTVTADNIKTSWLDANKTELEKPPVDAGAYYYRLTYTDASGVYGAKEAVDVRVIIAPVKLVVRPALSEKTYMKGDSVDKLLNNVTYELYKKDGTKSNVTVTDTFWGVSYNRPGVPQYYEPVFKVQMRKNTTVKNADGSETTTEGKWTNVTGTLENATKTVSETDEKTNVTTTTTVAYRVVFAGQKAVYQDGAVVEDTVVDINKQVDINSADTNYNAYTTEDVVGAADNAIQITVNEGILVTINTDDIVSGIASAKSVDGKKLADSVKNVYRKVYDNTPLFADRSAYKKAKTDKSEADSAGSFSYTWYQWSSDDMKVQEDDKGEDLIYEEPICGKDTVSTSYDLHELTDAGKYCLKITYKDPANKYMAEPAYLFFNVEQQLVKVAPKAEGLTAYTSNTAGDFIEKILDAETTGYSILSVKDNNAAAGETTADLTEEWKKLDAELEDGFYDITWVVLKGDNTDKDTAVYTEISREEFFEMGIPYKLGAKVVWVEDDNYTNKYDCGKDNKIQSGCYYSTLDITVSESANKQLEVVFDETKLDKTEKTYNGEAQIDADKLIESGYITVKESDTGETLPLTGANALPVIFKWENADEYSRAPEAEGRALVNAGTYRLTVSYPGDAAYRAVSKTADYAFKINPKELTVNVKTALENAEIKAGLCTTNDDEIESLINYDETTITGFIDADAKLGDEVFRTIYPVVYDAENIKYTGYLRYKDSYKLSVGALRWIDNAEELLKDGYTGNYEINIKAADFTVGKRGTSSVECAADYGMAFQSNYAGSPITVAPIDGVRYFYEDALGIGDEFVSGNYFVFDIVAPKEFMENTGSYNKYYKNFVYENSIESEKGKGFVISTNRSSGTIRAAFPVTEENKAEAREFIIIWEEMDGEIYREAFKVDFTNAQLENDLRSAVAPKSLAFNGVTGKMTVGETQQLDVKMMKVLNSDVVVLNYEVTSGNEFLSVTEKTGVVTALGAGSATVAVYPVRYNEETKAFEKLDFKPVTAKITVSQVSAPKINSVYAYDYVFDITYTKPSDGYRREIYVLEGKNLKPDAFETAINEAKKGNMYAEKFAAYKILSKTEEAAFYNSKTNTVSLTIGENSKLEAGGKDYTVYVRNVSGTRTLDDGSFVALSGTGTTKAFKTTTIQPLDLRLYYDSAEEAAKLTVEEEKLNPDDCDEIDLAKGFIQLKVMGEYKSTANGAEDSSYGIDHEWKELPIDKNDTAYATQKLTFYALDSDRGYTKEELAEDKELSKSHKTFIDGLYYKPSGIAKIDKNGKLTLTGIGNVYICAYDSVSKKSAWYSSGDALEVSGDAMYQLYITTPITGIQAKGITLNAGSCVNIYNSLTFLGSEKNKKLATNLRPSLTVTSDNDTVRYSEGIVIAEEPNVTANLTVALKDNPGVTTTLQVKTKAMDAVKSLKASDVIDHRAAVTFSHTSNYLNTLFFRIELRDNRNRLISSKIISAEEYHYKYDGKSYWYWYEFDGLKRQSGYNVTVTPIDKHGDAAAKPAATKFTTTNIPASEENLGKDDFGGMEIYVDGTGGKRLSDIGYLTSGNTYTLIAGADETAKNRKTDSLTWKSSNSKAATVKANAGTFTAALKAAGVGTTTIEVTSKITKKVIARYIVRVKSISNGGKNAYGDTEPKEQVYWDDQYDLGIEVLTEANPVSFDATNYDYRWVSFTAPADGNYRFIGWNANFEGYRFNEETNPYTGGALELRKGETIYLKVSGSSKDIRTVTIKAEGKKYGKMTISSAINAGDYAKVTFIAPEDNYYTFFATEYGKGAKYSGKSSGRLTFATKDAKPDTSNSVGLKKGEKLILTDVSSGDYQIYVEKRAYTPVTSDAPVTAELKKGEEDWYSFEANATGNYTVTLTNPEKIKVEYYADAAKAKGEELKLTDTPPMAGRASVPYEITKNEDGSVSITFTFNKGETIAVRIYTDSEEAVKTEISVSKPIVAAITNNTATVKVPKNGEAWVSLDIDEVDAEYCFSYDKEVTKEYYLNDVTKSAGIYSDRYIGKKLKDTLYIKLSGVTEDTEVTVTVVKTAATELALNTASEAVKVSTDSKTFYKFTAPSYGLYTFTGTTTAAEGTTAQKIISNRYLKAYQNNNDGAWLASSNANGFYGERMLAAGESIIFSVESSDKDGADTSASVTVSKAEAAALSGEEITLAAGENRWFKYTAPDRDEYKISWNSDTTAVVYYSAALDANMSNDIPNNYSTQLLSAGDTIYLKVSAAEETKIKFHVTSAIMQLPTEAFDVKANETVMYKYKVTKAGRYKVSYTSTAEDAFIEMNYSGNYSGKGSGTEAVFGTVGESIIFSITSNKDTNLTVNVTSIEPLEASESSVKNGDSQWFKFTVPVAGRYTVALTDKEDKALTGVSAGYVKNSLLSGAITDLSDLNENWLVKGDVYYIKVTNSSDAEQAIKVTFNAVTAETITLGTPAEVTLKEGETKWYSLKTEKGRYAYTIENPNGAALKYYDGTNNDGKTLYNGAVEKANAPIDKMIKVTGAGEGAAVKLTINKVEELTLEAGKDLQVTLADGAKGYISFKAPKTGGYAFRLKDIPENTTVTVSGLDINNSNVYKYTKLSINEEKDFILTVNFTSAAEGETKTVTLCAEEIVPETLTSELSVKADKGEYKWVTFEAPKDGRYVFSDDSTAVDVRYRYTGTEVQELAQGQGSLPYEKNLSKGDKVTLAVYYNDKAAEAEGDVPASAEFKLSVTEVIPTAIDNTKETSELTIAANTDAWYSYTAAANGEYSFAFANGETPYTVDLYTSMGDATHNDQGASFNKIIVADGSVYFKVSNNTDAEVTITVKVQRKEVNILTEGDAGNTLTITEAGEHYYLFKPSETHNHRITINAYYGDIGRIRWYIGNPSNYNYYDHMYGVRNIDLDASEEYYLYIESNKATTVNVTIKNCDAVYEAWLGNENGDYLDEEDTIYYEFTAECAGDYSFSISNVDAVMLDSNKNPLNLPDEDNRNHYSRYTYHMGTGEMVYIKVYREDNIAVEFYLDIALESMDKATEISGLDYEYYIAFNEDYEEDYDDEDYEDEYDEGKWFSFKPSETGLYKASVKMIYDEYDEGWSTYEVYVYDSHMSEMEKDDYGNCNLVANSIYYIFVDAYSYSDTDMIFKLSSSGEIKKIEAGETIDRYNLYQISPAETGVYTIETSGSVEGSVYLYDKYTYPDSWNYDYYYEDIYIYNGTSSEFIMYSDNVYYLRFEDFYDSSFSFKVNRKNVEELSENKTVSASLKANGDDSRHYYFSFTPDADGLHTFTFSGIEEEEWLWTGLSKYPTEEYEELEKEIYYDETIFRCSLDKGVTYFMYIYAGAYDDRHVVDFDLTVNSALKSAEKKTITVDNPALTEIEEGGCAVYEFTAPSTGLYSFYSDGEDYVEGYLYDENFYLLIKGEDSYYFPLQYSMTAGETVYLLVKGDDDYEVSDCRIHVINGKYTEE